MSTAAPNRRAVLCGWVYQGSGGYWQSCCSSTTARASKPPQERDVWCRFLTNWLKVSAICEQPVFGLRREGWVSLLYLTWSSCLASLLLRWKAANTVFVVLSFNFQVWRYSPTVVMSLVRTPSTVCQSPSACMIVRSSAYACFLETVVGRSEMSMLKRIKGHQDRSLWNAVLEAS